MESPGGNSEAYRSPSSSNSSSSSSGGSSGSRRFGLLSASNVFQAPLSALLEYSGILRGGGRSNHQETEGLISGRVLGFRDHLNEVKSLFLHSFVADKMCIQMPGIMYN